MPLLLPAALCCSPGRLEIGAGRYGGHVRRRGGRAAAAALLLAAHTPFDPERELFLKRDVDLGCGISRLVVVWRGNKEEKKGQNLKF